MKRKREFFLLLAALLVCWSMAQAQPKDKPLTNCDVLKLVKAGLPEVTIVRVIQQSATAFDTSTEALSELSRQGASTAILDTVLKSPGEKPVGELAGLPCHEGFFYRSDARWAELNYPVMNVKLKGIEKTFLSGGIVHGGIDVVLEGAQAQLRINDPQPTFYDHVPGSVDLDPSVSQTRREFVIVRLDQKETRRLLEVKPIGVFSAFSGFKYKKGAVYETRFTQVSRNVAAIQPKVALPQGEYLLVAATPGKNAARGFGYEFAILPRK